ncbi:MFS transporter [Streptomyces sp. NPDC089795]|uniref:MFS transporter n=1 Tax=Streptomyces sp. NPDC089795 TaxID=3155297 RepID=UPI0034187811
MTATTTEAVPPEAAQQGHPRRWLILAVICVAQLTVYLDNTVLNVAIPSLSSELDADISDIQWMINAYALVLSGMLLTAGSAADRYGRKKMLAIGLALFGLGSLAAGLSQTASQLIAARAGMGIGGALLLTTTLAVVVQVFADAERMKAISIWGAVSALGFAVGPLVGGALLNHFWWGSIFLINLPVSLIGIVFVIKLVPESKNPLGERPDVIGAVLSMAGMGSIVFAIISGPEQGWTSARTLVAALVGVVAMVVFIVWERRVPYPMLDMGFFRNQRFVGAVTGALLLAFGMGGSLFLLTQHLQFVMGYGPLEAGLRMAPLALIIVVLNLSGVGPKLLAKLGSAGGVICGMGLMAVGLTGVALLGSSYSGLLVALLVLGVGIGLSLPSMAVAIMAAIPPEKAGMGSGVNSTLSEFGNGLGVAVLGAVLTSRLNVLLAGVGVATLPAVLAGGGSEAERERARDAIASGLETSQLVAAAAVLLGGVVASALLHRAERAATAAPAAATAPVAAAAGTGARADETTKAAV